MSLLFKSLDNRELDDLEEEDEAVRLARFQEAASHEISERMQASMNLMMEADRDRDDRRARGGERGRGGEDEEEDDEEDGRHGEEDSEQRGEKGVSCNSFSFIFFAFVFII